ncbi:uncharacterized protein LOC133836844 [Drosophila sulfurigaster albostrigata]|uniref:uncharacterized protein LOC133836844 n=1 Tax=Drosophila sulfurigaster albostrigata TaxID=89887 RepID=UPI002D2195AB|nr:uncharacterized protein LOC133836844 [Drosophila sulfurigaster albostrigata]
MSEKKLPSTDEDDEEPEDEAALQAALREMVKIPDIESRHKQPTKRHKTTEVPAASKSPPSKQQKWSKQAVPGVQHTYSNRDATEASCSRAHKQDENPNPTQKRSETWSDRLKKSTKRLQTEIHLKSSKPRIPEASKDSDYLQMPSPSELLETSIEHPLLDQHLKMTRIEAAAKPKSNNPTRGAFKHMVSTQTPHTSAANAATWTDDELVAAPHAPKQQMDTRQSGIINILTGPFRKTLNVAPSVNDAELITLEPQERLTPGKIFKNLPTFGRARNPIQPTTEDVKRILKEALVENETDKAAVTGGASSAEAALQEEASASVLTEAAKDRVKPVPAENIEEILIEAAVEDAEIQKISTLGSATEANKELTSLVEVFAGRTAKEAARTPDADSLAISTPSTVSSITPKTSEDAVIDADLSAEQVQGDVTNSLSTAFKRFLVLPFGERVAAAEATTNELTPHTIILMPHDLQHALAEEQQQGVKLEQNVQVEREAFEHEPLQHSDSIQTMTIHGRESHITTIHDHCQRGQRTPGVDKTAVRKLIVACILCVFFMICEIIGGLLSNSLAIATDAAHLLTDLAGFLISLFALYLAGRASTNRFNFGWHRAEVIGALMSVYFIWVITGVLVWIAIQRMMSGAHEVDAVIMLITSVLAIVVNVIMAVQLSHGHSHGQREVSELNRQSHLKLQSSHPFIADTSVRSEDLLSPSVKEQHLLPASISAVQQQKKQNINVRAAIVHVIGDIVQSVGVFLAACIIFFKPEWAVIDSICTFIFSIIVLFVTYGILRDVMMVLMEATPDYMDYGEVQKLFLSIEGVERVHNLRIWALSIDKLALSAHLAILADADPHRILEESKTLIHKRYNFYETTIQVEIYQPDVHENDHSPNLPKGEALKHPKDVGTDNPHLIEDATKEKYQTLNEFHSTEEIKIVENPDKSQP